MDTSRLHGIHPILYAFFDADGRPLRAPLVAQVEAAVRHGAHGVAVLGLATETNKLDAVGNFMQRGWRPFIGWVGGVALAYQFVLLPLLAWVAVNHGWQAPPALASDMLFTLVTQLLGLGVLRTTEKLKGQS